MYKPSAFGYGKYLFAWTLRPIDRLCRRSLVLRLVAPTARALLVRPPLQRSDRPPFGRSFSAFPPPTARLCRRATYGGVGCGANDRPSASAFGRVALLRFAPLRSLGGVLSPLRSDHVRKENCKRLCLSQFFFRQNTTITTIYTIFALQIERRVNYE